MLRDSLISQVWWDAGMFRFWFGPGVSGLVDPVSSRPEATRLKEAQTSFESSGDYPAVLAPLSLLNEAVEAWDGSAIYPLSQSVVEACDALL